MPEQSAAGLPAKRLHSTVKLHPRPAGQVEGGKETRKPEKKRQKPEVPVRQRAPRLQEWVVFRKGLWWDKTTVAGDRHHPFLTQ